MLVYGVLIVYLILVNLIVGHKTDKEKLISVILSCLGFIAVQALRKYTVGIDLTAYRIVFNKCSVLSFEAIAPFADSYGMEVPLVIIMKLITMCGGTFQLFIVLTSIFVNATVGYFIYKKSKVPLLSFLLYIGMEVFVFSFSAMRQIISICFTLYAFLFLEDDNYLGFGMAWILAVMFHISASVFILALPFKFLKLRKEMLPFIVALMAVIIVFAKPILTFLITTIIPEYKSYLDGSGDIGFMGLFLAFTFYILFWFNYKDGKVSNNFLLVLVLLGSLCQLFGNVSTLTGRITFYFMPYFTILIPNSIETGYEQDVWVKRAFGYAYAVFTILALFAVNLLSGYLNVTPYMFFWQ